MLAASISSTPVGMLQASGALATVRTIAQGEAYRLQYIALIYSRAQTIYSPILEVDAVNLQFGASLYLWGV
jgi:hypothetical protein